MKKLLIVFMVLPFYGCGGHEPNPVAAHQLGDGERMCESLRLEIAQNEVLITKKLKKDEGNFFDKYSVVFNINARNGFERSGKN